MEVFECAIVPIRSDPSIVDEGARIQGGYDPVDMKKVWHAQRAAAQALVPATYKIFDVGTLTQEEIDEIANHIRGKQPGPDTCRAPTHGWTCFHCGETFKTPFIAQLHFGEPMSGPPTCQQGDQVTERLAREFVSAAVKCK